MEYEPELLQAILTVIIGVTVYALGEVSVKLLIEPITQLSGTIGEVLDTLIFYSNIYTNPQREGETLEFTDLRKKSI